MNVFPLDDNQEEEPLGTLHADKAHRNLTSLQGRKVRINYLTCLETLKTKSVKICLLLTLGSLLAFKTCLFMEKILKTENLFYL